MTQILQWNVRSLRSRRSELLLLLDSHDFFCLCLQETRTNIETFTKIKNFQHYFSNQGPTLHGGAAIFIKNNIPHNYIELNTNLHAVAINIQLDRKYTICSIYLPPTVPFPEHEIIQLLSQLPKPFIILGDLNARHMAWGDTAISPRGNVLFNLLESQDISFLNNGDPTYHHFATNSFSMIDLSLCSPQVILKFNWETHNSLCGSDHFPILLTLYNSFSTSLSSSKWCFKRANWMEYSKYIDKKLCQTSDSNEMQSINKISENIIIAANKFIPKSSQHENKQTKCWWNKQCSIAINNKRHAYNTWRRSGSPIDHLIFKRMRAISRRIICDAKNSSWRKYISTISSQTSSQKVWQKIRTLSNKKTPLKAISLQIPSSLGTIVYDQKEVSNLIGQSFSYTSSTKHYSRAFQRQLCRNQAITQINNNINEEYNKKFTLTELQNSLKLCNDTSPGPDGIHYSMIKHLSTESLNYLLNAYNQLWINHEIPESWTHATVIPILKQGKSPMLIDHYRPIALTNCLCKLFERLVNVRLAYYLETNNKITPYQFGFRQHHSTIDALNYLTTNIQNAFAKNEHVVAIFFDLEKAFDTTWRQGLINNLLNMGLTGNIVYFLKNFLLNRSFKVKIGNIFSDTYPLDQGIPQGSVLSGILFIIAIQNIIKCFGSSVKYALYADDLVIFCSSTRLQLAIRMLQNAVHKLELWCATTGFKFSSTKTKIIHFCRKRKCNISPLIYLNGNPIPVTSTIKYLGLILDSRLNWKSHINLTKANCYKTMNIMRCVSHLRWGADRTTLLRLYISLIRSKLDYGSQIYGSASEALLNQLDPIQNMGIRLSIGAFRTSPINSLHAESSLMTLEFRRIELCFRYFLRLLTSPAPFSAYILENNTPLLYEKNPKLSKPFGIRYKELVSITDIHFQTINYPKIKIAPWEIPKINFCSHLLKINKSTLPNTLIRNTFLSHIEIHKNATAIYTDGSKTDNYVSAAFVCKSSNYSINKRISNDASIYTAELTAILLALKFIKSHNNTEFVIHADSRCALEAINNCQIKNPIIYQIIKLIIQINSSFKTIYFCWVPAHVSIIGNELADAAAKSSNNLTISDSRIPATDYNCHIKKLLTACWQVYWTEEVESSNKLKYVKPLVTPWKRATLPSRQQEIILARLRIGHTRITHGYLMSRENQPTSKPKCPTCNTEISVEHILLKCKKYHQHRQHYFPSLNNHSKLTEMLTESEKFDSTILMKFLKEINIYDNI